MKVTKKNDIENTLTCCIARILLKRDSLYLDIGVVEDGQIASPSSWIRSCVVLV